MPVSSLAGCFSAHCSCCCAQSRVTCSGLEVEVVGVLQVRLFGPECCRIDVEMIKHTVRLLHPAPRTSVSYSGPAGGAVSRRRAVPSPRCRPAVRTLGSAGPNDPCRVRRRFASCQLTGLREVRPGRSGTAGPPRGIGHSPLCCRGGAGGRGPARPCPPPLRVPPLSGRLSSRRAAEGAAAPRGLQPWPMT